MRHKSTLTITSPPVLVRYLARGRIHLRVLGTPIRRDKGDIGHLTKEKIGHLANGEIPQMADVRGGFLLYTESDGEMEWIAPDLGERASD